MHHPDLAESFKDILGRLFAHEALADHERNLSGLFEVIATNLLEDSPNYRGCYFDGAVNITVAIRSPRTIEFQGDMWIADDCNGWIEPFRIKVVDKQITKQGIWITIWIGQDKGEGECAFALQRMGSLK